MNVSKHRIRIRLTRWRSTRASSLSIMHATWVIVAVALGAVSVGALAAPQSPVHQWLACQIGHVSAISATQAGSRSCASTKTGALTPPSHSHNPLAALFVTSTDQSILATWNGSAWNTTTPPAGFTPAWYAEGPMLAVVFANSSTSVTSVPEVQSGSGAWMALGADGPDQTSQIAWMGSSLYAAAGDSLWRWNAGSAWTDLGAPSEAWGHTSLEYLAVNAATHTIVVASGSGIGEYRDGTWSTLAYPHAMQSDGSPTALAVNRNGTVSVASSGYYYDASTGSYMYPHAVYQETHGIWSTLPAPAWPNSTARIISLASDGSRLVAGSLGTGVGYWNGTTWTHWGYPGGIGTVTGLVSLGSGRFAAATQGAGVAIGNGAGWTPLAGGPSVDAFGVSASQ